MAQTTLVLWSRGAYVAVPCAQPLTLRQSGGYKTMRATEEEMVGRFGEDFKIAGITEREAEYLARDRRLWSRTVYRLLTRVDQSSVSASPTH